MKIAIRSYPRLHFSLIDMSATGFRQYGGVGMTIDALPLDLSFCAASKADCSELHLRHQYSLIETTAIERRLSDIADTYRLIVQIRVMAVEGLLRHTGLGSGTRLILSCIEALFLVNGVEVSNETIRHASGRGGASGVGLHSYFNGGLSLDIGRLNDVTHFASSDVQEQPRTLPLVACSTKVPNWAMRLVIPANVLPISQDEENRYFERATPLAPAAVHEAAYVALYGVFGGAASNDYLSFSRALVRLQGLPWKSGEIALHGEKVQRCIDDIYARGADAVAMSSFGPALLCLGELKDSEKIYWLKDAIVHLTKPRNQGREVSVA